MTAARFDNILNGAKSAPLYDSVLLDLGEVVVVPTLGSIIPDWVLAIPKSRTGNIVQWRDDSRAAPLDIVAEIARRFGREPHSLIWFEHGPATRGSTTGCGVDHAHIHILLQPPFDFSSFKKAAKRMSSLHWEEDVGNPYDLIKCGTSYLVAGSSGQSILARSVDSAGSQFFRRVIAHLVDKANLWDYRTHPHHENVAKTLARYGGKAAWVHC